jgi:phage repressor protein C with HTH and peptisase S24 domain
LTARDEVSQLLLSEPGLDEIGGDFLGIHALTVSRSCLSGQHQRDEDLYYIRDMDTLAKRLTWARERKGLTQEALAKLSGVSQGTIGNLESGIRQTARKIVDIATAAGVDPIWLANGKGSPELPMAVDATESDDGFMSGPASVSGLGQGVRVGDGPATVPVRAVKLRLRAGVIGFSEEPDMDIDHGFFEVPKHVIDRLGTDPPSLMVMKVKGRSMEPAYFEDDIVLIDKTRNTPKNNESFAVNWNGELLIKCLIKKSDGWSLYSFNRDYPTLSVRSGLCSIIGMVVWQPERIVMGRL